MLGKGRLAAALAGEAMKKKSIKVPKVVYPGGLTPTEHAIVEARKWQNEMAAANTPTPSREYLIVRDLLSTFDSKMLSHAYKKGGLS
jgi:hypothetical protein